VLVAVICFAGEASPLPMMRISSHTADAGRGPPPSVRERGGHAPEKQCQRRRLGGSAAFKAVCKAGTTPKNVGIYASTYVDRLRYIR